MNLGKFTLLKLYLKVQSNIGSEELTLSFRQINLQD